MLAVTRMHGGLCIAGMTKEPDRVTGLKWIRPIRDLKHVQLGDITTAEGAVLRPFDVVQFDLIRHRPNPPHVEDWIAEFVRPRPRVLRRLEGERRTRFLRKYLDTAPLQVVEGQLRSLCLIKPDSIKGNFRLDGFSGKFDARMAFRHGGRRFWGSHAQGGIPVTDLKWRALGRAWLPEEGGWTEFEDGDLEARYGIQEVFLAIGLTRNFEGKCWPIVIGVHTVPDYDALVDYDNL